MMARWKLTRPMALVAIADEIPTKMEIPMSNQKYLEIQAVEMFNKECNELTKAQKDELRFHLAQMIINNY